eukprot:CAMPEP_0203965380 /NCGR_PEP_ID=MMETSP0359-20131031/94888_1 /ASSEMBLY_ACC=CAM_ASM_000338 /TAXON_ID=268821 /ORGANISM="Scrippsiella Hangoei, Strain SHTV-5" /LENGTH=40 /DNA_ID= /DNA_START= /DNA_END= /DNA_ORIENTATION=
MASGHVVFTSDCVMGFRTAAAKATFCRSGEVLASLQQGLG